MGLDDKIKNTVDRVTGAAKEKIGDARGDEQQQAEGKADQSKADLKQSGEHIKDAASDAKDSFKR
ncbi:MAG: CsbD family protein [Aeromicrobium sp.]